MAGSLKDISVETVVDMLKKYKNDPQELEFVKKSLKKAGCPEARIRKAESIIGKSKPIFGFGAPKKASKKPEPKPKKGFTPKPKPSLSHFQKPVKPKPTTKVSYKSSSISKKNLLYFLGAIVLLLLIALFFVMNLANAAKNCGTNEACFVQSANLCEKVKFENTIAGAQFKYLAEDCQLEKTVKKLAAGEPRDIKNRFEGKTMTCTYSRNAFDRQLIREISGGIQRCRGPLVDAIVGMG